MTSQIVFLCTGNYYRSRFAELLFNHLAAAHGLDWQAYSRGIAIERGADNPGPIAQSALAALAARGVALAEEHRYPMALMEEELNLAEHVVALKRDEHLPLMAERFPAWAERIEYWDIHDIDQAHPDEALPQIEQAILALLRRLSQQK